MVYQLDPDKGELSLLTQPGLASTLPDVYGFCLYHNQEAHEYHAFINSKTGLVEQWQLFAIDSSSISGKLIRKFKVDTQPEGMVVDDKNHCLFIGEEERGIWKFDLKKETTKSQFLLIDRGLKIIKLPSILKV